MRSLSVLVVGALVVAAPARAQVIQGESTYEDNFIHTQDDSERAQKAADPGKKGSTEKGETKPTDAPRGSE